jgi:DNA sulfur modification protein DndB
MITAKENVGLLDDLLYVHLAAPSKQSIVRARKQFRDIRGFGYPITDDHLQANLTPHTERPVTPPAPSPEQAEPRTASPDEGSKADGNQHT